MYHILFKFLVVWHLTCPVCQHYNVIESEVIDRSFDMSRKNIIECENCHTALFAEVKDYKNMGECRNETLNLGDMK